LIAANDDGNHVELPPLLDSDDIGYFFQRKELETLHEFLKQVFFSSKRNPQSLSKELPQILTARGGGDTYTTQHKLQVDLEQAQYLVEHNILTKEEEEYVSKIIPIYKDVLKNIPPLSLLQKTRGLYAFTQEDYNAGIGSVYNKALHITDFDTLRDANGNPISLLDSKLSFQEISENFQKHGHVVVDNLLSPPALERIRQLLLESTVWFQTKTPLDFGAYIGAYMDDGLYDVILLELAMELSTTFPKIFREHELRYLWAYKYDSSHQSGIHLHADEAAVNVNIWLTPDSANLDPTSGGLVIFTAKPPKDWNFRDYNTNTDFVREHLLKPTNYDNVTIPHKQNRAVIFDSALFHQTDVFKFQKGYTNRRINLTLLYGKMQKATTSANNGEDEF
jgi:hypothetical protein